MNSKNHEEIYFSEREYPKNENKLISILFIFSVNFFLPFVLLLIDSLYPNQLSILVVFSIIIIGNIIVYFIIYIINKDIFKPYTDIRFVFSGENLSIFIRTSLFFHIFWNGIKNITFTEYNNNLIVLFSMETKEKVLRLDLLIPPSKRQDFVIEEIKKISNEQSIPFNFVKTKDKKHSPWKNLKNSQVKKFKKEMRKNFK